jgi:hypothetical protein
MSSRSIRIILLGIILVVLSLMVVAPTAAAPAERWGFMTIGQARNQPLGTVVTIQGGVTVPSGAFSSATFDQGFAIQDLTGGIYVSVPASSYPLGARVRVTGTLADSFGLLIVVGSQTQRLPGATLFPPIPVRTGNVGGWNEGLLILNVGVITQPPGDDQPYGYRVYLNDGSGEVQAFIHTTSGINPFALPWVQPGNGLLVIGFSGFFLDHAEIDPRFPRDFRRLW